MPAWLTIERALLVTLLVVVVLQGQAEKADRRALVELATAVQSLNERIDEAAKKMAERPVAAAAAWGAQEGGATPRPRAERQAGAGGGVGGGTSGASGAADAVTSADPTAMPPAAGGRGNRLTKVRQQLAASGMTMMDVVYDAVDRMAEEEQWDDATYDEVASVFEQSAGELVGIMEAVQRGEMTPQQAREDGAALREDALGRLQGSIGPEGMQRLRAHWQSSLSAPSGRR